MKKAIIYVFVVLFISTQVFAGDYIYYEAHKTSGNVTVHLKDYYRKGYIDKKQANENLRIAIDEQIENFKNLGFPIVVNATTCFLQNENYTICFIFCPSDGSGYVDVFKGSYYAPVGSPMEMIYEFDGTRYTTYNTFYETYHNLCNKYLKMF